MSDPSEPIAIVGMSCLFPGSRDADEFWQDIAHGRDRLGPVPRTHWLVEDYYDADPNVPDKIYVDRGGFLDPIDFDAMKWGLPPSLLSATDSTQLLSLIVAERALRDAFGASFDSIDRDRVSVILGVTSAQKLLGEMNSRLQRPVWERALRDTGFSEEDVRRVCDRITASYAPWVEATFPGVLGNVVAGRIANRLDLGGTNCVTDAACASTFGALRLAVNELVLGQADFAICGGADTMNDPFMFECFAKTTALSKSGDCRPLSDKADGTMLGEGVAMVVLARLAHAERLGLPIYARVCGVGTSSDGRAKSVYAPLASGQAKALRRAYEAAGYGPETVELVEAHGTGTAAGDAAELEGLDLVFGGARPRSIAIGSVKSQIGHTKAAAGAAGLIKAALALRHGVLPPTIKVERPHPALRADGPFYVNSALRPWIRGSDHPRRASVSSFGFGGSNYHVALEEHRGQLADAIPIEGPELIVLGGGSAREVAVTARAWRSDLRGMLRFAAHATQLAYAGGAVRVAIVASTEVDLADKLERAAASLDLQQPLSGPGLEVALGGVEGSIGFLFPGQGSQYVGMGAALAMRSPIARAAWDRAADALAVHEVVFPPPVFTSDERAAQERTLTRTEWAQPALGVASAAMLAVLRAIGIEASAYGGHSFGEVSALFAAGAFGERELVAIARRRGELMAQASEATDGAMLAVSADIDVVRAFVSESALAVTVANHNHPSQVVLSGARDAIEAAAKALKERKIRCAVLDVATAFHSPIVAGSTEPFLQFLRALPIEPPRGAVYANATAAVYEPDVRALLARQIAEPVRFVEEIEAMYAAGVRTFVEVGAGAVLTALVGRILDGRPHRAVALDRKGSEGLAAFYGGLAKLVAADARFSFAALWNGDRAPIDPRTVATPKMAVAISGANLGKPYPLPPPTNDVAPVANRVAAAEPADPGVETMGQSKESVHGEALRAFVETQRQTADAHAAYQRAAADAHAAFLRSTEATMEAIARIAGATVSAAVRPSDLPSVADAPLPSSRAPSFETRAPLSDTRAPSSVASAPFTVTAPEIPAAPLPARAVPVARPALVPLMLAVVAEKTGYPESMLNASMELESELGIDSIKRVEILSALRERAPHLPEIDPAQLGKLRTLAEIAAVLEGATPTAEHVAAPVIAAAPSLVPLMLAVVAEKTGYPESMLNASMELESELGIDSIKRVEILSALRERAPHLPEIDPAQLGKLRTLAEIAAVLEGAPAPVAAPIAREATTNATVPRSELVGLERAAPGLAVRGLFSSSLVAVIGDPRGIGSALAERLRAHGVNARVVDGPLDEADAAIVLAGLAADPHGGRRACGDAFEIARSIAPRFATAGGLFVTVVDAGGSLGLAGSARAAYAGIAGLAKTAALEWPKASVRSIDLACDALDARASAERIARELVEGGDAVEVAIDANGVRRVPSLVERTTGQPRTMSAPCVVASGGARGVTAACLLALAEKVGGRYLLLGRSSIDEEPSLSAVRNEDLERALLELAQARGERPTPRQIGDRAAAVRASREVRATLKAFEAIGAQARYAAVDVREPEALQQALAAGRAAFGPFTALVHGAGVLADRALTDKRTEDFERVFRTKVDGLEALLDATRGDLLDTLVFFSSVAGRFGNVGQSDYAMANSVLDAVASREQLARPNATIRSLAWGPWAGGMVTRELAAVFAARGISLVDLRGGANAFASEVLGAGDGSSTVVLGTPLAGTTPAECRYEVRVDPRSHPQLLDHSVEDAPVLPVVLALEWMVRAARAQHPELDVVEVRDVHVLRGRPLLRFADGERFEVAVRLLSNGQGATYATELRDERGPCYRAQVELQPARPPRSASVIDVPALGPREGPVYGGALFHGPRFAVIERLDGVGDGGAAGVLVGTAAKNWPAEAWQLDPALLDGGLQLAVLWTERKLGGAALPTGFASLTVHQAGLVDGEVRAIVRGGRAASGRAQSDVLFVDAAERVIAELRGLETFVRPSTVRAGDRAR